MKKAFILATFILFAINHNTFSQKCNYDVNKKDEISGKEIKTIKHKLKRGLFVELEKNDTTYIFRFIGNYNGAIKKPFGKGYELDLKLLDSNLIKLYTNKEVIPTSKTASGYNTVNIISDYTLNCFISKSQLNQLSKSNIDAFYLKIGGKDFTIYVPQENSEEIKTSAKCILK
jgi:hypothetical protein